jgi:hypothetical protein
MARRLRMTIHSDPDVNIYSEVLAIQEFFPTNGNVYYGCSVQRFLSQVQGQVQHAIYSGTMHVLSELVCLTSI